MNKSIVSIGGMANVYGLAVGLLAEARKAEARLPEEERRRRKEEQRLALEERYRQASIIRNICPTCEGKLIRGKKDKRNDYKRPWTCSICEEIHSI